MISNPADTPHRALLALSPRLKIALGAVAAVVLVCTGGPAHSAAYTFQTLNNPGDLNFNQLLGINNAGTVGGYFGDGMVVVNNGYTLVPPNTYTPQNFPLAVQTQVVGINNTGTTVGFYIDGTGANHGFDKMGTTFTTIDNPLTSSTPAFNQLAGVNDANLAAGFYMDSQATSTATSPHLDHRRCLPRSMSLARRA
jgi:hypothetical protein